MFEAVMFGAMFSVSVTFCIFILCIILVFYWYYWLFEGPYKQFPTDRLEIEGILLFIFGKLPFSKVIFQLLLRSGRKFQKEGVCVMRFFQHFVLIYGEESSKAFFNGDSVVEKSAAHGLLSEGLGNGLLGSTQNVWKVHRKILNPGMSMTCLIRQIPIFNRNAHELLNTLQGIEGVPSEEVEEILALSTFAILAESILGFNAFTDKMGPKVKKFMKAYSRTKEIFSERLSQPWYRHKRLFSLFKIGREYYECIDYGQIFTREVIQEMKKSFNLMKKQSDEEQNSKKSIPEILFDEHLMKGNFTAKDIEDHVQTFMMAGYDTVYTALTWCLYELGHHPEVQQNLYDEIQTVIEGKDVSYEEICRMKYIDCVLKEALRLHPPVPLYGRKLNKDVQFGKYTVPKGSEMIFFPYMLHRDPDVYPDPFKFYPDRFLENSKIRPWMHLAFAEGYRNCIGKKFAVLQMKILLAHIIRTYKVTSLCIIEETDLEYKILQECSKGIRLLLTNRNSTNVANE